MRSVASREQWPCDDSSFVSSLVPSIEGFDPLTKLKEQISETGGMSLPYRDLFASKHDAVPADTADWHDGRRC